jgi:hypothetical protein
MFLAGMFLNLFKPLMKHSPVFLAGIFGRNAPYPERVVGGEISYLERVAGRFLLEVPVITAERAGGEGWFVVVFEPDFVESVVVGRRVRRGQQRVYATFQLSLWHGLSLQGVRGGSRPRFRPRVR